jgi:CheY-like chemotaxis protein
LTTADSIPQESNLSNVVGLAPGQPTFHILIVEDNATNRLLLKKMLLRLGFEVQTAENGEVGVARWQEWRPEMILMDMYMPVLNGYDATKQIRQLEEQELLCASSPVPPVPTKIIAITANAFTEQHQEILEMGCDDFVSKPFRLEEILRVFMQYLNVEYAYDNSSLDADTNKPFSQAPEYILDTEALTVMPLEWIANLQTAAIEGNDTACLDLIAQIPNQHASLIEALTKLIDTYQFDQIVSLSQIPALHI